ncbi:response regulator, partial [Gemmata sp.]|uniref:response regulator n=1 Tax=Gemmata sp. TaxID=1914242 RepID=UPI003F6F4448
MTERGYRLLVVGAGPGDRAAYRRALAPDRAEVTEADTGRAGLDACRAAPPDCVVLDHTLPDMDALEFIEALKDGRTEPPVPVVLVTGQGTEPQAVRALKAGARDYLVRGAAPDGVRRVVRSAMERHARLPERPYRVLIIDDSPEDRATYRRRLSRGPDRFEFREASTGAEGLALCREFDPDCVLLDYQLPDTDGLEVLSALSRPAQEDGGRAAVLVLTGQGNETVAVRALKAGAEDYLVKGPALDTLPQTVRSAVEKVALRRRVEEQRHELERHRNQLRVTLASIGDAVVATDPAGRVTYLNPVAEQLTGWGTADAAGRPLGDVFVIHHEGTRRPVDNPALRALRDGTVTGLAGHTVLVARDGTERPIDHSAAPIRDETGAVHGAVLVFRDVTERHRLEDELKRRVADLAAADKRKDEFLAMLAHELRNPLAPVKNALHVLKLRGGDGKSVDQVRAVMERQVGHLTRMVDDLLDVSRITQGKVVLKLERLDLGRLV